MAARQREEVLNVLLAQCISDRGMIAVPENILHLGQGKRAMPDIIVSFNGLRVVIEGKLGDVQGARELVADNAHQRVATGLAYMAIGVVYPAELRNSISLNETKRTLTTSTFEFMVSSEASTDVWREGPLDSLLDELRRVYDVLVRDDVVTRAVATLETGMRALTGALAPHPVALERLADTLGVHQPETDNADGGD